MLVYPSQSFGKMRFVSTVASSIAHGLCLLFYNKYQYDYVATSAFVIPLHTRSWQHCSTQIRSEDHRHERVPIYVEACRDSSGGCNWNGWTDGGADARLITYRSNVHSGNCALRIQDNTGTSRVTSRELDVDNKSTLKVTFWYRPRNMSGSENFHLDISKDDGDFVLVRTWSNMPSGYNEAIVDNIDAGANSVRVRFENEGAANRDRVFIDDITIEAMWAWCSSTGL